MNTIDILVAEAMMRLQRAIDTHDIDELTAARVYIERAESMILAAAMTAELIERAADELRATQSAAVDTDAMLSEIEQYLQELDTDE